MSTLKRAADQHDTWPSYAENAVRPAYIVFSGYHRKNTAIDLGSLQGVVLHRPFFLNATSVLKLWQDPAFQEPETNDISVASPTAQKLLVVCSRLNHLIPVSQSVAKNTRSARRTKGLSARRLEAIARSVAMNPVAGKGERSAEAESSVSIY